MRMLQRSLSSTRKQWIIVYDLDGTLLNTLEDISIAANNAMTRLLPSHQPFDSPTVKRMIGDGARVLMQRMVHEASGRTPDKAELDVAYKLFMEEYSNNLFANTKPYPNVVEGLRRLTSPNVTQIICTNKPEVLARRLVANSSLKEFFPEHAVTGAVPGTKQKPDAEHVLRALESATSTRHYDSSRTIVVGDGPNDIQVAHALGCRSIGVSYGFSAADALLKLQPTVIRDTFEEVTETLIGWIKEDTSRL